MSANGVHGFLSRELSVYVCLCKGSGTKGCDISIRKWRRKQTSTRLASIPLSSHRLSFAPFLVPSLAPSGMSRGHVHLRRITMRPNIGWYLCQIRLGCTTTSQPPLSWWKKLLPQGRKTVVVPDFGNKRSRFGLTYLTMVEIGMASHKVISRKRIGGPRQNSWFLMFVFTFTTNHTGFGYIYLSV